MPVQNAANGKPAQPELGPPTAPATYSASPPAIGPAESESVATDAVDVFPTATVPPTAVAPVATSPEPAVVSPAAAASPSVAQLQGLGENLERLAARGAIDQPTRLRLLEGLSQTDPALWPQLLAYFEAAAQQPGVAAAAPVTTTTTAQPERVILASASDPIPQPESKTEPQAEPVEAEPRETPKTPAKPAAKKKSTTKKPKGKPKAKSNTDEAESETAAAKPATEADSSSDSQKTYQQALAAAAERLERETTGAPSTQEQIAQHATLRLVYLLQGKREQALAPIPGIPAAQQDFWSKELFGLAALLDAQRNPDAARRAAEANAHLRDATVRLGEAAMLQVRNLALCREVSSYGVYKAFDTAEFAPGQEVLLYAEVENFKTAATDRGYHTALKASYQILDERGARVDEKEFAVTEEYCQNPRRDFFVRYFIWMPQKIYGGNYTLQLSMEDTLGHKIGQASLAFKIKSSE